MDDIAGVVLGVLPPKNFLFSRAIADGQYQITMRGEPVNIHRRSMHQAHYPKIFVKPDFWESKKNEAVLTGYHTWFH